MLFKKYPALQYFGAIDLEISIDLALFHEKRK